MLRLGKRGLPMLRLGRSVAPDAYTPSDKYFWSRQVPLPRYGRELELQYLLMNALKNGDLEDILDDSDRGYYGYNFETTPERQIRPAPRPGMRYKRSTDKPADESLEKDQIVRAPPLMRYGTYYQSMQTQIIGKNLTRGIIADFPSNRPNRYKHLFPRTLR